MRSPGDSAGRSQVYVLKDASAELLRAIQAELGETGRVLIRPSGTEPLVRVMVEAPTPELAESSVATLVAAVERACGS